MSGEILASGLSFPEGPVVVGHDIYFVEYEGGRISRWNEREGVRVVAETRGRPNGAALGPDGELYVAQSGGEGAAPGIIRVFRDGSMSAIANVVGGIELVAPCDLAFHEDGTLWFTDPNGRPDQETYAGPGRLFTLDISTGEGELVVELDDGFTNGIGFDRDGALFWAESFSRRIRRLEDGKPVDVLTLPEKHLPDGICWDDRGRLYVATTYSHSVTIIDNGEIVGSVKCAGGAPTNCCFDGNALITTDGRRGALWRHELNAAGLQLPFVDVGCPG